MKPLLASDILRKSAPRSTVGQSFLHPNRYDTLRDESPARSRADSISSQKRKKGEVSESDSADDNGKTKQFRHDVTDAEEVELVLLDSKITKVSTVVGKMYTKIQQLTDDYDPIREILMDLAQSVKETNEIQGELMEKLRNQHSEPAGKKTTPTYKDALFKENFPEAGNGKSYSSISRKKPAGGLVSMSQDSRGRTREPARNIEKVSETPEEALNRKFNEAIRDAERSTLCFNLDMGNVPLMNKATIREKAALALTKMAATAEGKRSSIPSHDAVAAIDDVTSLVTSMEFYGATTKQYKGKDSTGFCTVPVRYQFKDKDQKSYAEKTLREVCKVKCATPYPAIVYKQVVDHVRQTHPGDFVKVSVVPKEFSLKVSRRPQGKNLKWIDYPDLLRLPSEAINVTAKQAPDGLRMLYLPAEPQDDMILSPGKGEKRHSPLKGTGEANKK
jgi:hypothetical protein